LVPVHPAARVYSIGVKRILFAVLILVPSAVSSSAQPQAPSPAVAAVLADLNSQERWLYDAYVSDANRSKALDIRGSRVDFKDRDSKQKFLADTRKKLVSFGEREYQFDGGELAMLSAVLSDPAKAAAFKQESGKLDPADKAGQQAFIGRQRKDIVRWADDYMAKEHPLDLKARSLEAMVSPDERAALEQAQRNDENGFKTKMFAKWVRNANKKLASGAPGAQKRAVELITMARDAAGPGMKKYLESPEIAKLREPVKTLVAEAKAQKPRAEPASKDGSRALSGANAAPEAPKKVSLSASTAKELLEKAERSSKAAASEGSPEAMLAGAGSSFSGGFASETLAEAVVAGQMMDPAGSAPKLGAAPAAGLAGQKGLSVKEVPSPSQEAEKKGRGGASALGLGASGLGLIGLALLAPIKALFGAVSGFASKLFSAEKKD